MSEPLVTQAIAALKNEDFASARDCMKAYQRANPFELEHYLIRGLAELALKEWDAALTTLSEAIARYPAQAQLWLDLGMAQENLGDFKNAAISYERSLDLKPDQAEACGNLSNIYCRLARFAEAETMARRALKLGAPRAQALNSLGLSLKRQNRFAEAIAAFEEALRLEPDNSLVMSNLANLAADRLDFDRAWPRFAAARAASGDAPLIRHHEGMARLLAGDYTTAWGLYEARLEVPGGLHVQPRCPRWQGEPLAGKKLVLVAEQGFGDVIQFCRYGTLLEKAGAALIWVVPKNLQRLLAANLPGRISAESEPLPEADFCLPILSMPLALGLLKPDEAPSAPYLRAPASPLALPAQEEGKLSKIGLVWTGSPTHVHDHERSILPARLASLWEKIPANFYAPFIGAGLEQLTDQPIMRLDHLIKDFADTAALLNRLDCLVTVDTAAAHLAGALGIKTWLLLPYCPDWRWGTKGETTPWYPSLTLLRQPQPGDWETVIIKLTESLSSRA